jgi:acetyl/propionyl-CoA carboxylase alpha subunit
MRGALGAFRVAGVVNNVGFLSRLVDCRSFTDADLDTGLIEREGEALFPRITDLPTMSSSSRRWPNCWARRKRPPARRPGSKATAGA